MSDEIEDVALWPSRENYALFRSLCDERVPETFNEFEVAANTKIAALAKKGFVIRRRLARCGRRSGGGRRERQMAGMYQGRAGESK
jgi:hypothetical protein